MADEDWLEVLVVYALPAVQHEVQLCVPRGTTIRNAIERSRLAERLPELDLAAAKVGVFGVLRRLDDLVSHGDRVEIYRPLSRDPKAARRQRSRR